MNATLGLFVPSKQEFVSMKRSRSAITERFGGVRMADYTDFLFSDGSDQGVRRRNEGRLLGGLDDTGGSSSSSFEMNFLGDAQRPALVLWCSFVDGIDRGIQLPLLYTLKSRYLMSQVTASALIGMSHVPWLFKPFLGLLTDTVPIYGLRRKPYIIVSAGLNVLALSLIAYTQAHVLGGLVVPLSLMLVRTFGRAMIDAASQGLLLEECRDTFSGEISDQARTSVMVSRFQAAHRLGQFLSVCSAGIFLSRGSLTPIYVTIACMHAGTMLIAWATYEEPVPINFEEISIVPKLGEKFNDLTLAVSTSQPFRNVLEYAFLSVAVPSFEGPMTYYLLDARHFSLSDISLVNVVMTSGSLVAPVIYAQFFQRAKYSTLMTGLTIASIPLGLTPLLITTGFAARQGLDEVAIASFSAFMVALVNDLQMLPAHVLVAQLAPKGLEGSSLSVLSLVIDSGRVISDGLSSVLPIIVGASAPKYTRMSLYIALCTLFNVGPFSAIDGFDEGVQPIKVEELVQSKDTPTLGAVINDMRVLSPGSPMSSEASPIAQVKINSSQPSSETN